MQKDGILHDGEAEACAANTAAAALVNAVETLEDAGQVRRSDAYAVVAEAEHPAVIGLFGTDVDGGTLAGIVDGVVDEVAEDTVDERRVALYDNMLRQTVVKLHVALFKGDGGFLNDVADDGRHVGTFHRQLVGGVVHAVQRRYIL